MSDMTESELQAAERRINELVDELIAAAEGTSGLDVQDCRDALQEAIADYRTPGWQPIETAPKDGTHVLIADTVGAFVGEARYHEGHGWYWANNDPTDHWGASVYPTHWMPLPAAPAAESEEP